MKRRSFLISGALITASYTFGRSFKRFSPDRAMSGLYERFQNPTMNCRPFVRWWWNGDKIEKSELTRELRLLKEAGIGGVEINPIRFPAHTEDMGITSVRWLGKEWIDLLDFTLTEAKKLDMTCDLIVGSGWPFGDEWLLGEERSQMLTIATRKLQGPVEYEVSLFELLKDADPQLASPFEGRTPELFSVQLVPSPMKGLTDVLDLTATVKDGILKCTIPRGIHTLYGLVKMTGFMQVIYGAPGAGGPVLNHYNEVAVKKYLNRMSDTITGQIGSLSGRVRAFFCDSLELEGANWCSDMAEEFERRRGYALTPWLPFALFKTGYMGDTMDPNSGTTFSAEFGEEVRRVRYDFELTKTELFKERFIDAFTDWCRHNGVLSRMQAYGRGYMPVEGSFYADIPECETWIKYGIGGELSYQDYRVGRAYTMVNKYVSSAAHLKGKREISCEELTNTEMVFFETLETLKLAGDQSTLSGVTHPIFHGFNYSPKDAPFPGWVRYGCYFNERNPWWPYFHLFTVYKARVSAILQQGDMYADIAILSATADLWKRYGSQNDPFPQNIYPEYQTTVWEAMHQNGNGCDYISESVIQAADMNNGHLHYGPRKYKAIFLIAVESMEPATAKKLLNFVQVGGSIFCIEKTPTLSNGWKDRVANDKAVQDFVSQIKVHKNRFILLEPPKADFTGWYQLIQKTYNLTPYLHIDKPNNFVSQIRYQTENTEVLFIINSDSANAQIVKIIPDKPLYNGKQAWLWDAEKGERYALPEAGFINMDLGPADAKLLIFDKTKSKIPENKVAANSSGTTLPLQWTIEGKHINGETNLLKIGELKDLMDLNGWESFCGIINYTTSFDIGQTTCRHLDLGKVAGISEVSLNGQTAGIKWYGRRLYAIEKLLQPGENTLTVKVTTTMGNYMKSLTDNPVAQYWTNSEQKNQRVQPMGLLGPVRVY